MQDSNTEVLKRLDALLGLALTRLGDSTETSLSEHCRFLRNLGFSNGEIATLLGKTTHHIEVVASKLMRGGKLGRRRGKGA